MEAEGVTATYRVLFALLVVACVRSETEGTVEVKDPEGHAVPVRNISGCHMKVNGGYRLACDDGGRIAPIRYVYFLLPPDIQQAANCNDPGHANETVCCSRDVRECRLLSKPTKDLYPKVDTCSVKVTECNNQPVGWTTLFSEDAGCDSFGSRNEPLYSSTAELSYLCVNRDWEVNMGTGIEERKEGQALFLTSPRTGFNDKGQGFNLSCSISAEQGKTIDIRALDLRLCSERQGNGDDCGQVFHVIEGDDDVTGFPILVTPNNDDGYLGLKRVYQSRGNAVTIRMDSVGQGGDHAFSVWLYVVPSSGKVVITCSPSHFFTTTTTTTTTTSTTTTTTTPSPSTANTATAVTSSTTTDSSDITSATAPPHSLSEEKQTHDNTGLQISAQQWEERKQLEEVLLLYVRMATTGLAAILLILVLLLIIKCCTCCAKQRRLKREKKREAMERMNAREPLMGRPSNKYEPVFYKNPAYYAEKDWIEGRRPASSADVYRPANHRGRDRPLPARKAESEARSTSSQSGRNRLVELVANSVCADPDMEASLRQAAGSAAEGKNIREVLGQLTTKCLKEALDKLQAGQDKASNKGDYTTISEVL